MATEPVPTTKTKQFPYDFTEIPPSVDLTQYYVPASGPDGLPVRAGLTLFKGDTGDTGLSAYQVWISQGNTGSEQDYLNSLQGTPGEQGDSGQQGDQGLSAYQIWLNQGNTGSEQDFLNSLKGTPGTPGAPGTNTTPRGQYSSTTTYNIGDVVYNSGSSYVALVNNLLGVTPSNDQVNWSLSALKGNDGTGSGDMNKATYDTNNNGIVDNSEQLAGYTPSTLPISTTAQSALDLKVNTSDIINDTTTGGTTVPLSAEMGKYLQEQITTAQQSNHDRGVVWKAINNSGIQTRGVSGTPTINNGGINYQVGDALIIPSDVASDNNAIVIVSTVNGSGTITAITVSKEGDYSTNIGGNISVTSGHGTGAILGITMIQEPASTLADIVSPQPNDIAIVLYDETHSNTSRKWGMMDYNGDGVYNRVPLAPNNSERSFTTNPIVASELGTNAVTTEKIVNNAVTDDKIGTRAITDVAASYTLVSIAAKTLTNWLTGIYANLKYILQNMQTKIIEAPVMLTFATSLSIDMSQSLNYILNISDNTTLSFNNITPGRVYTIQLVQDGTGGRNVSISGVTRQKVYGYTHNTTASTTSLLVIYALSSTVVLTSVERYV